MKNLRICAVGDLLLAYRIEQTFLEGNSLIDGDLEDVFRASDLRIGNLELPFSSEKRPYFKKKTHWINPSVVDALDPLQLDIVNLANNHILDWGLEGLEFTIDLLTQKGIRYCGAGRSEEEARQPAILRKKGKTIAVFGYARSESVSVKKNRFGAAMIDRNDIYNDISMTRELADLIIVNLHWGIEYSRYPHPRDIELGHHVIDAGANIVLGHHPHQFQKVERFSQGIVAYSLGNFLADITFCTPPWYNQSEKHSTFLLLFEVDKSNGIRTIIYPAIIEKSGLTRSAKNSEAFTIKETLSVLSSDIEDGVYRLDLSKAFLWQLKQIYKLFITRQYKEILWKIRNLKFRHFLYLTDILKKSLF